jgi:type VI secretion system protein ImpB
VGSESLQKKLGRVNRARVHIQYDVEIGDAIEKVELPFVVGVMADLSGQPKQALKPMKERELINISHENFDAVLAGMAPRLAFQVDNKLTDEGGKLNVELNFNKFEDFEPAKVAEQVPALKELLAMRSRLAQLKSNLAGNDQLEQMLAQVLASGQAQEMAEKLSSETPKEAGQ